MRLVAGLGNPGAEYADTLHNVGFDVVDRLAAHHGAEWRRSAKLQGVTALIRFPDGETVRLLKPMTFMNLSGRSIATALRYYGGTHEGLIVVYDDADLEPGRIRLRGGGGSGGHRGMASIIAELGTDAFARIRVGIGRPESRGLIGHVLAKIPQGIRPRMDEAVETAAEAVDCLLGEGLEIAMNRFNVRPAGQDAEVPKADSKETERNAARMAECSAEEKR